MRIIESIDFDTWVFNQIKNHVFACTYIPKDVIWSKNEANIEMTDISNTEKINLCWENKIHFMNKTEISFSEKVKQLHYAYETSPYFYKIEICSIIIDCYPNVKDFIKKYLL